MRSLRSCIVLVARIAVLGAFGVAVFRLARVPYDDAFIHLRVAENLALRGQPYFNVGERVMGDSSPLWVLLLAGMFKLSGGASTMLVAALESVAVAALVLVTERLLALPGRVRSSAALGFAAALVGSLVLLQAGFLMETALALALAMAAVLSLARGRPSISGLCCALAVATRYEMALLVPTLLAAAQSRERLRFLVGLLPPAALECVFLLAAYGTVVPNTLRAKSIVYQLSFEDFLYFVPALAGSPRLELALLFVGGALVAWCILRMARTDPVPERALERGILALAAFGVAVIGVYAARRTFMFPWYWPHALFPLGVSAAVLALSPGTRWFSQFDRSVRLLALAIAAISLVPFVRIGSTTVVGVLRGAWLDPEHSAPNLRTVTYQEIGRELWRDCPDAVVMAPEIGALGYTFKGKILDAVGLVSPEVLRFHPLRVPEQRSSPLHGSIPAAAVAELRPDFIVTMDQFATDIVRLQHTPALAEYQLQRTLPVAVDHGHERTIWSSRHILVLRRSDVCASNPQLVR